MKNNLLTVNVEKPLDMNERLIPYSDLLELIVMNKIQRGDFDDIVEEMTAALGSDEECDCDECGEAATGKASDTNSRKLLCAGYTDCMDEAIRFLVEEENISPEHPVVRNLKAHLEQSKDRILETASGVEFEDNARHHVPYHEYLINSQWNAG